MPPDENPFEQALRRALEELTQVDPADPGAAIPTLRAARDTIDTALDEAMALAALDGSSLRQVAHLAGLAPNTLSPRLGRTAALGGYGEQGRVGSVGIERARYDKERGQYAPSGPREGPPMRFRERKKEA